jgi:hypothetical protein
LTQANRVIEALVSKGGAQLYDNYIKTKIMPHVAKNTIVCSSIPPTVSLLTLLDFWRSARCKLRPRRQQPRVSTSRERHLLLQSPSGLARLKVINQKHFRDRDFRPIVNQVQSPLHADAGEKAIDCWSEAKVEQYFRSLETARETKDREESNCPHCSAGS